MEKKITKRQIINMMIGDAAINGNETYMTYLANELALLDKEAERRQAKAGTKSAENDTLKAAVVEALTAIGKPVTVTELIKEANLDLSTSKVTYLLTKLVEDGVVKKSTDKRKSLYSV